MLKLLMTLVIALASLNANADNASDARLYRISLVQVEIEKSLNDPDSVKYDFKGYNLDNGALCYDLRSKNKFNGYVRTKIAVLKNNDVVMGAKGYKKHCSPNANYEMYSY